VGLKSKLSWHEPLAGRGEQDRSASTESGPVRKVQVPSLFVEGWTKEIFIRYTDKQEDEVCTRKEIVDPLSITEKSGRVRRRQSGRTRQRKTQIIWSGRRAVSSSLQRAR